MSEHTPGTWFFDGSTFICARTVYKVDRSRIVASVHSFELRGGDNEKQANGRLIAAAPETAAERDRLKEVNAELLAALRGMLDIVAESRGVIGYHQNESEAEWGEFQQVDGARAAVAKAEGRS